MNGLFSKKAGFSLVELMVSVAIIAVVVSISLPQFANFQSRAKTAEANVNLRSLVALAQSYYYDERDLGGSSIGFFPSSRNDFSSETSCNSVSPNPFGFKLSNCRKINYQYVATKGRGNAGGFAVEGTTGSSENKTIFPKCCATSVWNATSSNIYHSVDPSNRVTCLSSYGAQFGSRWNGTDPAFDFNQDGIVDSVDNSMIGPLAIQSGIYGNPITALNTSGPACP